MEEQGSRSMESFSGQGSRASNQDSEGSVIEEGRSSLMSHVSDDDHFCVAEQQKLSKAFRTSHRDKFHAAVEIVDHRKSSIGPDLFSVDVLSQNVYTKLHRVFTELLCG
ncbi:hypothetical protein FOZ62_023805 [Perkinsus olseni]|uniref:Uncharacterized protein n=1 Tax=Perkinsus olseni TaxID=32597 RepID=A0A7J6NVE7_PEROL|nr:hypothetical protein FOZ62_023805 [Perkinsus olseni]